MESLATKKKALLRKQMKTNHMVVKEPTILHMEAKTLGFLKEERTATKAPIRAIKNRILVNFLQKMKEDSVKEKTVQALDTAKDLMAKEKMKGAQERVSKKPTVKEKRKEEQERVIRKPTVKEKTVQALDTTKDLMAKERTKGAQEQGIRKPTAKEKTVQVLDTTKDLMAKERTKGEKERVSKKHTAKEKTKEEQERVIKKPTAKGKTKEARVLDMGRSLSIRRKAERRGLDQETTMLKTIQKDPSKNPIQKIQDLAKEKTQEGTLLHLTGLEAKIIQDKETLGLAEVLM
jgi:uncharacterized protein YihD (DUF1040 family)